MKRPVNVLEAAEFRVAVAERPTESGGSRVYFDHLARVYAAREAARVHAQRTAQEALTNPGDRPDVGHYRRVQIDATRWRQFVQWLKRWGL